MSWLYYVNPWNLVKWLAAEPKLHVPPELSAAITDVIETCDEALNVKVPRAGAHTVIEGAVAPMEPGTYLFENGEFRKLEVAPLGDTVPPKSRRAPHPHVTSTAHAGYCLIVDALKAFIRERLYEPTVVYLDKAAETILLQHFYEQGYFGPTPRKIDQVGFRRLLPKLLGCRVVWDAPSFRFGGEEDAPKRPGPPLVPHDVKCAHSVPFATQPMKVRLAPAFGTEIASQGGLPLNRVGAGIGRTVRPIDNVDLGLKVASVTKADVPVGKSLSPQAEELIRTTLGTKKFL